MTRPSILYESPYQLRLGEDIWDLYDRLIAADVPRAFEIELPDGSRVSLATLEMQKLRELAEGD
jgi:hypothetical protein